MFASVEVKDYTIQLDGKPMTVKKERWLGIVNRKDGVVTDEEKYFEIRYVYKENGGMHTAHNRAYELIDTELYYEE